MAVLAPTVGPDRRRLDHRDLLLALAVPDQCPARHRRGRGRGRASLPREAGDMRALPARSTGWPGADGGRAGSPGDRPEGGARARLGLAAACSACLAPALRRGRRLRSAHPRPRPADRRSRRFADRNFADRLLALSFILGHRPLRLGLSDAGVPRLRRASTAPLEIGAIMLVTGVAQLVTAPIAVELERRVDAPDTDAGRLLAVRRRAGSQRLPDLRDRLRRDVLAAGPARLGHHVLPAAADPARARPLRA